MKHEGGYNCLGKQERRARQGLEWRLAAGRWLWAGLMISLSFLFSACPHKKTGDGRATADAHESSSIHRVQVKKGLVAPGARYVLDNPAQAYNGSAATQEHRIGVVEKRVYDLVEQKARTLRRTAPQPDVRLAKVASDLVKLPKTAHTSDKVLAFLNASRGLLEPVPLVLTISAGDSTGRAALDLLDKRLPSLLTSREFLRVGACFAPVGKGVYRLVLALQESHISTVPLPRKVACGGKMNLLAWVVGEFKKPSLVVTLPNGQIREKKLSLGSGGRVKASLALEQGRGRYQVEILAHGVAGPMVLANFPVFCGMDLPTAIRIPKRNLGVTKGRGALPARATVEAQLFKMLNRDRKKAGRRPLKRVDALVLVARSHSEEMCRTGRFGHLSSETGSADDRLREAGYRPRIVGENLAQAASAQGAHSSLMGSPSHRANIMSPKLTHVGVGVMVCPMGQGSFQLYVTQLFMRP